MTAKCHINSNRAHVEAINTFRILFYKKFLFQSARLDVIDNFLSCFDTFIRVAMQTGQNHAPANEKNGRISRND